MTKLRSLCVFCGARPGRDPKYVDVATKFGKMMAEQGLRLVYGGGDVGIMAAVANAVMVNGGQVTGVFPVGLKTIENEHTGLSEIIIVDSMHERKHLMFQRSDAFITFPGGYGTMDETFEILTWRLLNFHNKPVIIYNQDGYYNKWLAWVDQMIFEGFAGAESKDTFIVLDKYEDIIPTVRKLIEE